jgi:hypothetical protein
MLNDLSVVDCTNNNNFLYINENCISNVQDFQDYAKYLNEEMKCEYHEYFNNRTKYNTCFNFIQTNIKNNYVSIKCPISNNIIGTNFYFLITGETNVLGNNLYCCYYFKKTNQILVSELGSGLGSMYTNWYSLINFCEKNLFFVYKNGLNNYVYNKILEQE